VSVQRTGKPLAQQLVEFRRLIADLPAYIGTEAVRFFQDSFTRQGFIDTGSVEKWKARGKKAKRNTRGILIDTGALRRSIRIVSKGRNYVVIGATQPYAQVHNEGFRGIQHVRPHKRKRTIKIKYKNSYTGRNVTIKGDGKRYNVKGFARKVNMPKRQFMGKSAFLDKRIIMQIEHRIKQIMMH
jgi:phage gpG-like protein